MFILCIGIVTEICPYSCLGDSWLKWVGDLLLGLVPGPIHLLGAVGPGPGSCLVHSRDPFVGPCWAPGSVGAIHLLGTVGPWTPSGPFR